jgi:hypothetical protein
MGIRKIIDGSIILFAHMAQIIAGKQGFHENIKE